MRRRNMRPVRRCQQGARYAALAAVLALAAPVHAPARPAQGCGIFGGTGLTVYPAITVSGSPHHGGGEVHGALRVFGGTCPPVSGILYLALQYHDPRPPYKWLLMDLATHPVGGCIPDVFCFTIRTQRDCISGRWRLHYYGHATLDDGSVVKVNRFYPTPRWRGRYVNCSEAAP